MKKQKVWKLTITKNRNLYLNHFKQVYNESRFAWVMDIIFRRLYHLEGVAKRKKEEAGEWVDLPEWEDIKK